MTATKIEWTDRSWNPVTGCTKVSPGCDNCYAEGIARRFAGGKAFPDGFAVTPRPTRLDEPLHWRRPARVFVNPMSDLFHDAVTRDFLVDVFAVMTWAKQHTFQILTKRHSRMRSLLSDQTFWVEVGHRAAQLGHRYALIEQWLADGRNIYDGAAWRVRRALPNVWLGVSVEDQKRADLRIPYLLDTPAAVRFLSCEPLLGPVDLSRISLHDRGPVGHWEGRDQTNALTGARRGGGETARIDWVIVGGESGARARPMHPDWARQLRDQSVRATVPFFFKQHGEWLATDQRDPRYTGRVKGGYVKHDGAGWAGFTLPVPDAPAWVLRLGKRAAGRELDGRTWDEFPAAAVPS